MAPSSDVNMHILLYAPNIIGYIRLLLVAGSWVTYESIPITSFILYGISLSLDFVDGWSARKLKQVSAFGAWFDVVIDNLSRGMLWCRLYSLGFLVACLEWLCFVCTHQLGSSWKSAFAQEPWFVKQVMMNNFHTPLGMAAIAGLHLLPLWLYGCSYNILTDLYIPITVQYIITALLFGGRLLCSGVEIWFIWAHIKYLISYEANRSLNDKLD